MFLWTSYVGVLRALLFTLSQPLGGSVGGAIIALSFTVRLALLPLPLRLARRSLEAQRKSRELEPALARLRQRHAADPARLLDETRALHRAHGVQMMPKGSVLNLAVQLPLGAGLYQAIAGSVGRAGRFLWVADLARPDRWIAAAAAAAATAAALAGPTQGAAGRSAAAVSGVFTLVVAWRLSAGLGLYWGASSLVGVVQALILRREVRAAAVARSV
ncbi:MAG: membrane protein insertase YidC [Gemmatimonadaceae bacterium]